MSPQDRVERVLKEIHIAFAKCETYENDPNKMIIDRKEFLGLLDRLNQGIYDMLDQYEQTRQSRSSAERAFKKKGDEIIEDANHQAEDVYAASVLYTTDALGKIQSLIDATNDSMNDLFRQFRKDLREQKEIVKTHETELQGQLADLSDSRKYLSIIDDMNRERARKSRDLKAEKEAGLLYAKTTLYSPSSSARVNVNPDYFEKAGKEVPEEGMSGMMPEKAPVEKPDVKVNTNAAYFKWKAQQDGADPETGTADETENRSDPDGSTQEFPDEEAIRQAVLQDELAMEAENAEKNSKAGSSAGSILKTLLFGKDE